MQFVLFDIDGTLIDSGGVGIRSMDLAFREMFSIPEALSRMTVAGKTDLQIVKECLALHGLNFDNGVVPAFFHSYVSHLRANIGKGRGHVKKGIREALEKLKTRNDYTLGLLTGNIREGAFIKLEFFGLASYFVTGAFGNDHEDRNKLLPIAVQRAAEERSVSVGFSDCVVIGDTPRDVECAKPYGAKTIGVATGPYPVSALSDAGADVVFEDLSDTEKVLDALAV